MSGKSACAIMHVCVQVAENVPAGNAKGVLNVYQELDKGGKERYKEKLVMLGSIDNPYLMKARQSRQLIGNTAWIAVEYLAG